MNRIEPQQTKNDVEGCTEIHFVTLSSTINCHQIGWLNDSACRKQVSSASSCKHFSLIQSEKGYPAVDPCFLVFSHLVSQLCFKSCDFRVKSGNPEQIHVLGHHRNMVEQYGCLLIPQLFVIYYLCAFLYIKTSTCIFLFHSMPIDLCKCHVLGLQLSKSPMSLCIFSAVFTVLRKFFHV